MNMRLMIYVFFVVLASVALARVELAEKKPKKVSKERKPAAKPAPAEPAAKSVAKEVAAKPEAKKTAKPGAKKTAKEVPDFDNTDSCKHFCERDPKCVKQCMELSMMMG